MRTQCERNANAMLNDAKRVKESKVNKSKVYTPEQKLYLIGKKYKEEKKEHGGDRGNQYTKVASPHFNDLPKRTVELRNYF